MFAIILANAGLITVLLINEGASQGELVNGQSSLFSGSVVTASEGYTLTKAHYAKARIDGATQLIAFAQKEYPFYCEQSDDNINRTDTNRADADRAKASARSLILLGIDTQALYSYPFDNTKGENGRESENGREGRESTKNIAYSGIGLFSGIANQTASTLKYEQVAPAITAGVHPLTMAKLACNNVLIAKTDIAATTLNHATPRFRLGISTAVPKDNILVSIADFYRQDVTTETLPLSGFISLTPLSREQVKDLKSIIPVPINVQQLSNSQQDTGSLPDSFKLNLWAMGALMAVVALFIVLNALNLMYRTRLPNIIRLRQLGIASRYLTIGLLIELFLYCLVSVPIGCALGFYAASMLSPIISGTFSSLFDAVFVTPDVSLLTTLSLSVCITFLALGIFALLPAKQLSGALSINNVKAAHAFTKRFVLSTTLAGLSLLLVAHWFVSSTLHALLFVALLLLVSCTLVILWLPLLANWVVSITPTHKPVLHFIIASTAQLSSRTKLAVCAFFIALTANIGMNVMTDSFRSATESWLTQRLYAPAYLYTDVPLSEIALPEGAVATPLLRLQGKLAGNKLERSKANAFAVSISSYPIHNEGKLAFVVDSEVQNAWTKFEKGKGVYINQQLAFAHDIEIGDTLTINRIAAENVASDNVASGNIASGNTYSKMTNNHYFSSTPSFNVLGIYPDYGSMRSQILLPLSQFNRATIGDEAFSGVLAISYNNEEKSAYLTNTDILDAQGNLFTREELLKLSMDTFDKTFILTDGLNITTLLVAGIAFAVSLSILSLSNASSLSVLRALGVSKTRVKLSLLGQYIFLCILTALLAVPFGIYLAYVFIFQVNRLAFNWVYPLSIDAGVIITSVAVSLGIICLVIALPLGRMKPKVDLRQDTPL